jgi:hypothetical protein
MGRRYSPCDQVFVEGLMLVPQNHDTQNRHRKRNPDYNGIFSSLARERQHLALSSP